MLPADSPNTLAHTGLLIVRNTTGGTSPVIRSVTGPSGTYNTNSLIDLTVLFDQPVRVSGTPRLRLNSVGGGSSVPSAVYQSGSGTDSLVFSYTVSSTDKITDLDYESVNAVTLDSGASIDDGFLAANLVLAPPGSANSLGGSTNIVINTVVLTDPGKPAVVDGNSSGGGGCGMGGGVAILGSLSAWAWRRRQRRAA